MMTEMAMALMLLMRMAAIMMIRAMVTMAILVKYLIDLSSTDGDVMMKALVKAVALMALVVLMAVMRQ